MTATTAILVAALGGVGAVFGTDVFFAIIGRPALARMSDQAVLEAMGRLHEVGDRRMPFFGVIGIGGAAIASVSSAGRGWALCGLGAQIVWLLIYVRVAKPLNARMTDAVRDGASPTDARSWQRRWDAVIVPRALLMTAALFSIAMALSESHR